MCFVFIIQLASMTYTKGHHQQQTRILQHSIPRIRVMGLNFFAEFFCSHQHHEIYVERYIIRALTLSCDMNMGNTCSACLNPTNLHESRFSFFLWTLTRDLCLMCCIPGNMISWIVFKNFEIQNKNGLSQERKNRNTFIENILKKFVVEDEVLRRSSTHRVQSKVF